MTIKKAYVELVAFLEANENKKVKTILSELKAMCEAKNSSGSDTGSTFIKDEDENVVAIYCYYFKRWMPLCDVEFGAKKNTASGFNTMCKSGVSLWTKQQRVAKRAKELLLDQVSSGEITVEQLPELQASIEEARKLIAECDEVNFETSDELNAYLRGDENAWEREEEAEREAQDEADLAADY